jgi:enoyl-CoA hydratase/carnithine racemase
MADVAGASCGRLLAELEDHANDPPRALLVCALGGIGAVEARVPTPRGLRDPAAVLAAFPAPTVAVWNGPAIGAGAEVLLAADVRVIGPHASMTFPEVEAGELPCWGGTQRLTRAGGVALALRMLVVGDTVDAVGLERSGLALLVDDPRARAEELATRLAAGAPRAQAAARDAVQRGRDLTLADALRLESDLNLLISTTQDRAEGIAAFFEKRAPRFTGE